MTEPLSLQVDAQRSCSPEAPIHLLLRRSCPNCKTPGVQGLLPKGRPLFGPGKEPSPRLQATSPIRAQSESEHPRAAGPLTAPTSPDHGAPGPLKPRYLSPSRRHSGGDSPKLIPHLKLWWMMCSGRCGERVSYRCGQTHRAVNPQPDRWFINQSVDSLNVARVVSSTLPEPLPSDHIPHRIVPSPYHPLPVPHQLTLDLVVLP